MSMLVNSYQAVTPLNGTSFGGSALVNRAANLSIAASTDTVVQWTAEQYDDNTYHDNSTNPDRMTVPAGQAGDYFRTNFGFNLPSNNAQVYGETLKNGSRFDGCAACDTQTSGGNGTNGLSAPVTMASGDYFTVSVFQSNAGSITLTATDGRNYAQIERLTNFDGALVKRTSDLSLVADTTTLIDWHSAVYDTQGFWAAGDPGKLTVPAGVSLVRVTGNCVSATDANGGEAHLVIRRNGNAEYGLPRYGCQTSGGDSLNVTSALVQCSPGDYFELLVLRSDTTSVTADNRTWFAIEAVEPARKRAMVYRSANQVISAGALTIVDWDAEVYDTDSFHSTVTNTSRLTVPSGATRVRVIGNYYVPALTAQAIALILKNGSTVVGCPEQDASGLAGSGAGVNVVSAIMDVTAGDYFEMQIFSTVGMTIGAAQTGFERTWFAIEVLQ